MLSRTKPRRVFDWSVTSCWPPRISGEHPSGRSGGTSAELRCRRDRGRDGVMRLSVQPTMVQRDSERGRGQSRKVHITTARGRYKFGCALKGMGAGIVFPLACTVWTSCSAVIRNLVDEDGVDEATLSVNLVIVGSCQLGMSSQASRYSAAVPQWLVLGIRQVQPLHPFPHTTAAVSSSVDLHSSCQ
ncbi:hypothetical protein BD413DRAFT_7291 [Trametes elegans]|nr:hypothetical protein BD413DRAFT_7291 [Trametes elegans]